LLVALMHTVKNQRCEKADFDMAAIIPTVITLSRAFQHGGWQGNTYKLNALFILRVSLRLTKHRFALQYFRLTHGPRLRGPFI